MSDSTPQLYRTATGKKLHLPECPHVLGVDLIEATEGEHEICTWCLAEITGYGRTYHASVQDALRDMGAPEVSIPVLVLHLAGIEHDTVYVPHSRSYVALGRDGLAVAWAGKTYVGVRGEPTVFLPEYVESHGGGSPLHQAWGETCEVHFVKRSLTGVCEGCL